MPAPLDNSEHFAIVLAAGRSSRMGREKARLPWLNGQTLLPWTMDTLTANGWTPRVVVGPDHFAEWQSELGEDRVALNPHPELGKTTSLAAGIRAVPATAKWILLTAVDQPRLPALYRQLRDATQSLAGSLFVPDREGHRGHPVAIAVSSAPELLELSESDLGLRGWLDRHDSELVRLPGNSPESLSWDLNTSEAYESALAYFREHLAPNAET